MIIFLLVDCVWEFFHKRYLHKKRLNRCLNKIKPDITVIMTRREVGFIASMTDGSVKIAENHVDKSRYMDSMNPHLIEIPADVVKT